MFFKTKTVSISTSHIVEQAYHVKANLYKKLKDTISENKVYVLYADTLMQGAEKLVKEPDGKNTVDKRIHLKRLQIRFIRRGQLATTDRKSVV